MTEQRECPMCGRTHEVADDGTIATWNVRWSGDEAACPISPERAARLRALRAKHPERVPATDEERGKGYTPNYTDNFIHHEDALSEYNHVKRRLIERGDWHVQQAFLVIEEGERVSWDELFGIPGIHRWQA
jgi:hypothetical protein